MSRINFWSKSLYTFSGDWKQSGSRMLALQMKLGKYAVQLAAQELCAM